jgi:hypothetical protein
MRFIQNTFRSPEIARITGLHDGLLRQLRHRGYLTGKGKGGQVEYETCETARALSFACLLQVGLPPRVSKDLILPENGILIWAQIERGAILDPERIAGKKLPLAEVERDKYTPPWRYWVYQRGQGQFVANLNQYFKPEQAFEGSAAVVFDLRSLAKHFVRMAAGRSLWIAVQK